MRKESKETVIVCDSDLHFQDGSIRSDKKDNVGKIQRIKPDLVIAAGDLTNNGSDGKSFPTCCGPWFRYS